LSDQDKENEGELSEDEENDDAWKPVTETNENSDFDSDFENELKKRPRKKQSSSKSAQETTPSSNFVVPKKYGGLHIEGVVETKKDASYLIFKSLKLEDRTRAYAASWLSMPGRPLEFDELLGTTSHPGNSAFRSERMVDPDEAVYESVLEAWEGTNLVRGNRRKTLLAKLDKKKPNLGGYFPSLDLLAALDPHEKRPH
jgi:hypothetical protein